MKLRIAVLAAFLVFVVVFATDAWSKPEWKAEGTTKSGHKFEVILYDEPCALKAVGNLPRRATWTHDGKTLEGCWGLRRQMELIMTYFEDRDVEAFPMSAFEKLLGV